MLLSDEEVAERIESPLNLLNRLRTSLAATQQGSVVPSFPTRHPSSSDSTPSLPPTADNLIDNLEEKLQNSTARAKALGLMNAAMDELKTRLPEIKKPETLANLAYNMSRVVAAQDDNAHNRAGVVNSQIIVYAPQVQSLDNFEIIDAAE